MKIVVSGGKGVIGSLLVPRLRARGHEVITLTRSPEGPGEIGWDPDAGQLDARGLAGVEGAVHLAGENVGAGRWTKEKKRRIRESRVRGTRLLAEALARLDPLPRVMVSASGASYYPGTSHEWDENGPRGAGFLAEVCEAWEAAADPAREAGIRVVHPRIGVVITPEGGALAKMLPVFKAGLGGQISDGTQRMAWIHPVDLVAILTLMLEDGRLDGPVNAVAPKPVTNKEMTRAIAAAVKRPAIARVPRIAIKTLFGEMGEETVLADSGAVPAKLKDLGFQWQFPEFEAAVRDVVG